MLFDDWTTRPNGTTINQRDVRTRLLELLHYHKAQQKNLRDMPSIRGRIRGKE